MKSLVRNLIPVALGLAAAGCSSRPVVVGPTFADAPSLVLGEFDDDYGGRHSVSPREWIQHPGRRYHIVQWNVDEQYLIAWNDSSNRSAAGKWTRIDWVPLSGMPPYVWAFCFSTYNAASRAAAESVTIARHATPRTGCNGFPFSRLRRRSSS